MLFTAHLLTGALIGTLVRRPLPAFTVGVASHFLLDAVPHWAVGATREQWMTVAVLDGLIGLLILARIATAHPSGRRIAMLAGAAGAGLPDLDKPVHWLFGIDLWPAVVNTAHTSIQHESLDWWFTDALAIIAMVTALAVARRHRLRPTPASVAITAPPAGQAAVRTPAHTTPPSMRTPVTRRGHGDGHSAHTCPFAPCSCAP